MPPPAASPIREHPRKGSSIGWWVSSMSLQHYKGVSFIYVTVDTFLWYVKFVSLHLSTSCCMATIIKIDHFFSYQKVCLYGVFSCHSPLRHQLVCLFDVLCALVSFRYQLWRLSGLSNGSVLLRYHLVCRYHVSNRSALFRYYWHNATTSQAGPSHWHTSCDVTRCPNLYETKLRRHYDETKMKRSII